ncbi:MAG: transcription termination factor NusA [Patescibacteria group bacterium]|nr:transcription termination factor NusA [Patescibacteria group bacterium]
MLDANIKAAIDQIVELKGIPKEAILTAIENGMAAAYKRDHGNRFMEVEAELCGGEKIAEVYRVYHVVDEVIDPRELELEEGEEKPLALEQQITLEDAKEIDETAQIGSTIRELVTPEHYGRIAAMAAKQAIMQKLRASEGEIIRDLYETKIGTIVTGQVQRTDGDNIIVQLDRTVATLQKRDQIPGEKYIAGEYMKFYIVRIIDGFKGATIIISRTHPLMIKEMIRLEVPEVADGVVEVKRVAREAGIRSKVAVTTADEDIDSVGSCVGQSGVRIQNIMQELNGEFIDIIEWDENPVKIIERSLAPAELHAIRADERGKRAKIYLEEDERSLAIGKNGQNVRLASKLSGWEIDVLNMEAFDRWQEREAEKEKENSTNTKKAVKKEEKKQTTKKETKSDDSDWGVLTTAVINKLTTAGYASVQDLKGMDAKSIGEIPGIGKASVEKILAEIA